MDESEAGVNLAKQMEKEKEQEAGKPGDMGAIDRSHSLNLNTAPPPVAVEARGTVENGENGEIHRAEVSGAKDSMAGKPEQSSGVDQKLPKCEQVDYESETEGCENPADKDALVTVVGNEGLAGFGNEDERAQVLTIVKKDESADEVGDSINPLAAVVYREEKVVVGASTEISAVRPAGSRSSSFHGVTR
jgi:AP2-like factor (ANT lineage)